MAKVLKNYAFIDGNNLYLGAKQQNINLDYGKLRQYLRNKLKVDKAFLFIGFDPQNNKLYSNLQRCGFVLVFKPVIQFVDNDGNKTMKGNVDAELVLYASAVEYANYDKAVIISSDGDFACLIDFLIEQNKLLKIITPTAKYSKLLKGYSSKIIPLAIIKDKISSKK